MLIRIGSFMSKKAKQIALKVFMTDNNNNNYIVTDDNNNPIPFF